MCPHRKYTPRDIIFSTACESVEGCGYAMDKDIGKRYDVLLSNTRCCERCGAEMYRVIVEHGTNLDCPNCRQRLQVEENYLWD